MRFGTVAIVGRSNVGKSTFLNAVLGEPLAIVSHAPQTTRDSLLGVVHLEDAQIAFLDTPGLHQPRSELGRRMNHAAIEAARGNDVVVMMTDVSSVRTKASRDSLTAPESTLIDPADQQVMDALPASATVILAINKVDLLKDKPRLLPMLAEYQSKRDFAAIVPMSVKRNSGVDRLLGEVASRLPEAPKGYSDDTLTDRPLRFFIREYIREAVLHVTGREVPHASAVSVDQVEEKENALIAMATIHVEKEGQRKIMIGRGGEMVREIGSRARKRLETLNDKKVHLELFVRLTPRWRNIPRQLAELGYEGAPEGDGLSPKSKKP
jgi:GTPase